MSEKTKLREKVLLNGNDLSSLEQKMSPPSEFISDSEYIEPPYDRSFILMSGVGESCTDELINLYVLLIVNHDLNSKVKIEALVRANNKALVKFNSEVDFERIKAKQALLPELGGNTITLAPVKVPNSIKIYDFPAQCNEELLRLYFSNPKVSDGGEIERIRVFTIESKALIQFKNYKLVEKIVNRTHVICDGIIKAEKFYTEIESDGFYEDLDEDFGGRTISDKYSTTSDKLGKLKSLKDTKNKSMEQLRSPSLYSSMSNLASDVDVIDKRKLVLSNIQENINLQQLEFFISLITDRSEISQVHWSYENKGKVMLEFKQELNLKKVFKDFNESPFNNLNGKPIQIEAVNLTRTLILLIKETKPSDLSFREVDTAIAKLPATKDLLVLYLVNKTRSGGGEIEFIERKSSRYWIVRMKDRRVIKDLMTRKHFVDCKQIKVYPYYENFGLPYLITDNDEDEDAKKVISYKLKVKDDRLRFFVRVKHLLNKLNDILSESNAISKYNRNEPNVLYVTYLEKHVTKIPYLEKVWRIKVKESIEYFMQLFKYEKLTLSYNQWSTILKTKQINEHLLYNENSHEDLDNAKLDNDDAKNKVFGHNVILTVKDTTSNIEINVVGPTSEVEKFIVKIKDIICKAYFTYELEERIINFKTYLLECETLLNKWLSDRELLSDEDDSDVEMLLSSSRANLTDTGSLYSSNRIRSRDDTSNRLDKNKRKVIDDFITKLERDHLDMELCYGKLFQELGYTFLSRVASAIENYGDDDNYDEDAEYRDFNDRADNGMDDNYLELDKSENESQMDKIKSTLDELKSRITEMRKKFRNYLLSIKKNKKSKPRTKSKVPETTVEQDEDEENNITLCVYVKEQMKIITLSISKKCKLRTLKQILVKEADDDSAHSVDRVRLSFNGEELTNDNYTITDYGITNKSTITCELNG